MGVLFFIWRLFEFALFSLLHGSVLAARLLRRGLLRSGPAAMESLGLFVTALFESLGATFVKVGQVMSTRPDLLPPAITGPLKRLQDKVAPFDTRLIPALIHQSTGQSIDEGFAEFEMQPISSASVAHVHRARLEDGRVVAVKVRRPGLLRKVKYDLLVLRLFTRALNLIPDMHLVSLPEMVEEFGQAIYRQLDFRLEAANNRRFRENFAGSPHVKIPALVGELCTESLLTMEFLGGLERLDELDLTQDERRTAARVALAALYQMIFADGFVHADMHPGNVFFRKGGDFVLLDLGLVGELSEYDLNNFVSFFFAMVTGNGKECARVIWETASWRRPGGSYEAFERDMEALIAEHAAMGAGQFEVSGFAAKLFDTQRHHGVRNTPTFATTTVSLIVFEGITKFLDPDLDFQAEGRAFFAQAMGRRALKKAQEIQPPAAL